MRGLTVKGFRVIREYESRYLDGLTEMKKLHFEYQESLKDPENKERKGLIAKQSFAYGIESIPSAFVSLFYGKDIGKLVIKL